jgi:hypothetical protein
MDKHSSLLQALIKGTESFLTSKPLQGAQHERYTDFFNQFHKIQQGKFL